MTNQEAIIQLDYLKDFKTPDQVKALDMAIKALEQEPNVEELQKRSYLEGFHEALKIARKALEQEPTDTWSIKDVADTFKKTRTNKRARVKRRFDKQAGGT